MNKFTETFRALRHRNYRLFFIGQGFSVIGTMMQQMAQGWLVYRLTNSPLMLGVVAFTGQLPSLFMTPIAGLLSDRKDRKQILLYANTALMVLAFVMAGLVMTGVIRPWHIIIFSIISGIAGTFEMTTRHSFIPQMVDDPHDLGNAIALNSVLFNVARLTGPAIAGIIVAAVGEGWCFIINGISFITVLIALFMMKPHERASHAHKHPLKELAEGFHHAFDFVPVRYIILLMAFISLSGSAVLVLLPVFARDILHGGPDTFGFLTGSVGLGALAGALYMAGRKTVRGLGNVILLALFLFGAGLICASFTGAMFATIPFLMLAGVGTMLHMSSSNTIIQTVTDDDTRGRVMSFYLLSFSGIGPFGNLLAGWFAKIYGVRAVLAAGGVLTVMAGIAFIFMLPEIRRHLRPIYIKMGIITDVEVGLK